MLLQMPWDLSSASVVEQRFDIVVTYRSESGDFNVFTEQRFTRVR